MGAGYAVPAGTNPGNGAPLSDAELKKYEIQNLSRQFCKPNGMIKIELNDHGWLSAFIKNGVPHLVLKKKDSKKSNFKATLKEFNRTQIAFPHTPHISTSVVWQRGAPGIMGAIGGIAVG